MFALQQRLQLRHNQVFLYLTMTKDHLELLVDELNNIAQIELLDPNKKLHQTIILYTQYSAQDYINQFSNGDDNQTVWVIRWEDFRPIEKSN